MSFGHEGGYAFNEDQRGYYRSLAENRTVSKPETPKPKRTLVEDPEIKAMHRLAVAIAKLDDLPPEARDRCRRWGLSKLSQEQGKADAT
jgi:hypothetical protein